MMKHSFFRVLTALVLCLALLTGACLAQSQEDSWVCPACGANATANFCANCGRARNTGVTLYLSVDLDKNMFFSKYAVDVYLDGELLTTLEQGGSLRQVIPDQDGTIHVLCVSNAEKPSQKDEVQFLVRNTTAVSIKVHAGALIPAIYEKQIGFDPAMVRPFTAQDEKDGCLPAVYEECAVEKDELGPMIRLQGKVTAMGKASLGFWDMLMEDEEGHIWYIRNATERFGKHTGKSIEVGDEVTVYGSCFYLMDYKDDEMGEGIAPNLFFHYSEGVQE